MHLRYNMLFHFKRISSVALLATLLAACAGPSASVAPTALPVPTAAPTTQVPIAATQVPEPTSAPATAIPATEPPIAAVTATPVPAEGSQPAATVQQLATVDGQVVLQLSAGA